MRHLLGAVVIALATFSMVLFGAAPAHADDASYLAALADSGVLINPFNSQAFLLQRGDYACRLMRAGVPADQVAGQLGFNGWAWNSRIADAAQHELCPDTLH